MIAPFTSLTVIQRFIRSVLVADSAVVAAVGGADRIKPNFSLGATTRHLVHEDYGSIDIAKPLGSSVATVCWNWSFIGWEPGPSQQALEPLMEAVMNVLVGSNTRGKTHRYVDGARLWSLRCDYVGPDKAPLDVAPAGIWAPIREVYRFELQQLA